MDPNKDNPKKDEGHSLPNRQKKDKLEADRLKQEKHQREQQLIQMNKNLTASLPSMKALDQDEKFQSGETVKLGEEGEDGLDIRLLTRQFKFANGKPAESKIQLARHGEGMLVLDKKDAKKRNFAELSVNSHGVAVKGTYDLTRQNALESMSVENTLYQAYLDRPGAKNMRVHKTLYFEFNGAATDHTKRLRLDPRLKDNPHALNHRAVTKPFFSVPDGHCSHCKGRDHSVWQCWGRPDSYGYIPVCPCNQGGHTSNECKIIPQWSEWTMFKMFFLQRINLPPFKHEYSWIWQIVNLPLQKKYLLNFQYAMQWAAPRTTAWSWTPLSTEYVREVWLDAKPWNYHDYTVPAQRWDVRSDPKFDVCWLRDAQNTPDDPFGESFVTYMKAEAQRLTSSNEMIKKWRAGRDDTIRHDAYTKHMQAWQDNWLLKDQEDAKRSEYVLRNLLSWSAEDADLRARDKGNGFLTVLSAGFDASPEAKELRELKFHQRLGKPMVPAAMPAAWNYYPAFELPKSAPAPAPAPGPGGNPEGTDHD